MSGLFFVKFANKKLIKICLSNFDLVYAKYTNRQTIAAILIEEQ